MELVEDARTHEMYALKRIPCHSAEDQRVAMIEVEGHKNVQHPGVMEMIDYDLKAKLDPLEDLASELLILMPYYPVRGYKNSKILLERFLIFHYFVVAEGHPWRRIGEKGDAQSVLGGEGGATNF